MEKRKRTKTQSYEEYDKERKTKSTSISFSFLSSLTDSFSPHQGHKQAPVSLSKCAHVLYKMTVSFKIDGGESFRMLK